MPEVMIRKLRLVFMSFNFGLFINSLQPPNMKLMNSAFDNNVKYRIMENAIE